MQLIFKERYDTALCYSIIIYIVLFLYVFLSLFYHLWLDHLITWLHVLYVHVRFYATWIFARKWLHDDQYR